MLDIEWCKYCDGTGEIESIEYHGQDPEQFTVNRDACPYCRNGLKAHSVSYRKPPKVTVEEANRRAIEAIEHFNEVVSEPEAVCPDTLPLRESVVLY